MGLSEEINVELVVPIDEISTEKLVAQTFALKNISSNYNILSDGKWRF